MNKFIKPKIRLEEKKVKHPIYTDFFDLFNENLIQKIDQLIKSNDEQYMKFIKKVELSCGFINISLKNKKDISQFEIEENIKVTKEKTFEFQPIGYLESCFPEKFSVPRQGNLLKLTKAKIIFNSNIDIVLYNFTYRVV